MAEEIYEKRIGEFRALLNSAGFTGGLWSNPELLIHLSGNTDIEGYILFSSGELLLITDKRFLAESKLVSKSLPVQIYTNNIFAYLEESHNFKGNFAADFNSITHTQFNRLKETQRNVTLLDSSELISSFLGSADKMMLEDFNAASEITRQLFRLCEESFENNRRINEKQLKFELLNELSKTEASGFSFDPIIAVDANSAKPHHSPGESSLHDASVLLVDLGVKYHGICTDVTRTFVKPDNERAESAQKIVKDGFNKISSGIKAGVKVSELTQIWIDELTAIGLESNFTHALGHGLGYKVHQNPRISTFSDEVLKNNSLIAIEPAIYFPGEFGYRFECDFLVTETGCRNLTGFYV